MTVQELTKIAMRVQCDGRYAAAGHDGKMLWSSTFTQLGYARQYVSGCDTWVIVDDYAVVEQSENPHADYPGGADQYREDVATLTEAGALGDKATRGDWRWNFRHGTRYGDVATALESEASDGECFDIIELGGLPHMMVFSNADADMLVNAARVARALSRYMPWVLARLGGA